MTGARLGTELAGELRLDDDAKVIAGLRALRQTFELEGLRFATIPLEADVALVQAAHRGIPGYPPALLEELDTVARRRCGHVENDYDAAVALVCLLEPGHAGACGVLDWWEARSRGELERAAAADRLAERWAAASRTVAP